MSNNICKLEYGKFIDLKEISNLQYNDVVFTDFNTLLSNKTPAVLKVIYYLPSSIDKRRVQAASRFKNAKLLLGVRSLRGTCNFLLCLSFIWNLLIWKNNLLRLYALPLLGPNTLDMNFKSIKLNHSSLNIILEFRGFWSAFHINRGDFVNIDKNTYLLQNYLHNSILLRLKFSAMRSSMISSFNLLFKHISA